MNVTYYLTIDKVLVHFGSEVRKVSYTHSEAQRLYNTWKDLILTLVLPLLTYLNKSAGHPTSNTFKMNNLSCTLCAQHTHKTTRILCLFWDRKYYIRSPVFSLLKIWQIMKRST